MLPWKSDALSTLGFPFATCMVSFNRTCGAMGAMVLQNRVNTGASSLASRRKGRRNASQRGNRRLSLNEPKKQSADAIHSPPGFSSKLWMLLRALSLDQMPDGAELQLDEFVICMRLRIVCIGRNGRMVAAMQLDSEVACALEGRRHKHEVLQHVDVVAELLKLSAEVGSKHGDALGRDDVMRLHSNTMVPRMQGIQRRRLLEPLQVLGVLQDIANHNHSFVGIVPLDYS